MVLRQVEECFADDGVGSEDVEASEELDGGAGADACRGSFGYPAVSCEVLDAPIGFLYLPDGALVLVVIIANVASCRAGFHGHLEVSDAPRLVSGILVERRGHDQGEAW